jgi:hypothetical protein
MRFSFLLVAALFLSSCTCTQQDDEILTYKGFHLSFLKNPDNMTIHFPTSVKGQEVKFIFMRNPAATPKSLKEIIEFLKQSDSHLGEYKEDFQDCKHFAYKLFEEAQAAGYKASYVILNLHNQEIGHALVAFESTDAGLVYADFTPVVIKKNNKQFPSKAIVQVAKDKPYIKIPLSYVKKVFQNKPKDFVDHAVAQESAIKYLEEYNKNHEILSARKYDLERRVTDFNFDAQRINQQRETSSLRREQNLLQVEINKLNRDLEKLAIEEEKLRGILGDATLDEDIWVVKAFKLVP